MAFVCTSALLWTLLHYLPAIQGLWSKEPSCDVLYFWACPAFRMRNHYIFPPLDTKSVGSWILCEPNLAEQWLWLRPSRCPALGVGVTVWQKHMALPSQTERAGSLISETNGTEGHVWVGNSIEMESRHPCSSNSLFPLGAHGWISPAGAEASQRNTMAQPPRDTWPKEAWERCCLTPIYFCLVDAITEVRNKNTVY